MYAIVRTGGKQYRVEEGRSVVVERLYVEEGQTIELDDVLLIAEDGTVTVGRPTIEGARVLAHVDNHGRAPKIIVFTYKNKVRTRSKTGHRQPFTQLTVEEILLPGQEAKGKPKRARRAKAAEEAEGAEAEAVAPEADAVAIAEPVAAEETPLRQAQGRLRRGRAAPKAKPAAKAEKKKPAARGKADTAKAEKKKPAARGKAETARDEKKKPARRSIIRRKKKE